MSVMRWIKKQSKDVPDDVFEQELVRRVRNE